MTPLVNSAFVAWTHGRDLLLARISIFEHIRDIPYSLAIPMTNPTTAPEKLLRAGRGYCGPKHLLLAEMYRILGLDVRYVKVSFSWNDPDIYYPPGLRELAASLPTSHHLACRVRINDRWALVDATWDLPLGKAGFPVNEHWDGYEDTKCAVTPIQPAARAVFCPMAKNGSFREGAEFCSTDSGKDYRDEKTGNGVIAGTARVCTPEERERIARFLPRIRSVAGNIETIILSCDHGNLESPKKNIPEHPLSDMRRVSGHAHRRTDQQSQS